ncbi:MAG TPA: OsmC family protein [Atribacteraceae bacterium]|nr:OsmC family protein [Atribacteraceae bacterium]
MAQVILTAEEGRIAARIGDSTILFKSSGAESQTGHWPTQYIAAALGSCFAGTAFKYAATKNFSLTKVTIFLSWHLASAPARIGGIEMQVTLEGDLSESEKDRIVQASERACLVMNTLRRGVDEIKTIRKDV